MQLLQVFCWSVATFTGTKKFKKIEFILITARPIAASYKKYLDFYSYCANKFDAHLEKFIAVAFASENFMYQTWFKTIKPIGTLKCAWSFSCSQFSDTINLFAVL